MINYIFCNDYVLLSRVYPNSNKGSHYQTFVTLSLKLWNILSARFQWFTRLEIFFHLILSLFKLFKTKGPFL